MGSNVKRKKTRLRLLKERDEEKARQRIRDSIGKDVDELMKEKLP